MFKLAICDDDTVFSSKFYDTLLTFFKEQDIEVDIKTFSESSEFILSDDIYDAVFLDIEMPETDGFGVAENLNKKSKDTLIIFTSMHNNFVFKSFEYTPFSFLRKDEINSDLEPLLKRTMKELHKRSYVFSFNTSEGVVKLNTSEIYYIEVMKNTSIVHTDTQSYYTRKTLTLIEKELTDFNFLRSHKSFLVNCSKIYKLEKNNIILDNQKIIPLSRVYEKK
ncbi:MAG: LytTR family DNA-binding domain-containing protein [Oscillospiraceae bacterium]|jgi:DNA-binding LytR/AlgR family response regulator|nr:LytTR family DNA-binding domain-containing protein [Oscillospiraceae bacterium]